MATLMALLGAHSAGAAPELDGPPSRPPSPHGAVGLEVVDGEARMVRPSDARATERRRDLDHADPSSFLDGVRASHGVGAVTVVAAGASTADLTGDGLADVLLTMDGDVRTLEARRGLDGAALWTVPLDGVDDAFPWPVDDLTGDGIDDLLVWSIAYGEDDRQEECEQPSLPVLIQDCTTTLTSTYRWLVGARSGADGELLWSREIEGLSSSVHRQRDDLTSSERVQRIETTAGWVWLSAVGDADGDGLPDVVLQIEDARWEERSRSEGTVVAGSSEETRSSSTDLGIEMLAGGTGEVLAATSVDDVSGYVSAWPVGAGTPDLLLTSSPRWDRRTSCEHGLLSSSCTTEAQASTGSTSLLDGATLSTRWTQMGEGYSLGADVDGDDLADIAFDGETDDGKEVRVVSGSNGETVWDRQTSGSWTYLEVLGDLDGDGLDDLVLLEFEGYRFADEEASELEAGYDARRLRGLTGEVLAASSARLRGEADGEPADASTYVTVGGDHDGDGMPDLVASMSVSSWDEGSETWSRRGRLLVESGLDGAHLYQLDDSPHSAWSTGDLTGDGNDEVMLSRYVSDGDDPDEPPSEMAFERIAVRISDGTALWRHVDRWYSDGSRETLDVAGDQDGEPGAELLHIEVDRADDGDDTTTVRSLHGASLDQRWSLTF